MRADVKMELTHKLDHEIAEKKQKVAKGRCSYLNGMHISDQDKDILSLCEPAISRLDVLNKQ